MTADAGFTLIGLLIFALPSVWGVAVVAGRWRDRPTSWTLGWLCNAAIALTYAAGLVVMLVKPSVSSTVFGIGLTCAAALGGGWLLARGRQCAAAGAMKRLAAAEGHPVPRGRITAPVLVVFYLTATTASIIAAVFLQVYGAAWVATQFTLGGIPLRVGLVPALLLLATCVGHLTLREMTPLFRDVADAWSWLGRR